MHTPKKKRTWLAIFIVMILVIVFAARAYLPIWAKDYVNTQLAQLDGYSGSVADVDIHLWRGAYKIQGLTIDKTDGGTTESFVKAGSIDLSVQWLALFRGAIVAEADIRNADINFSKTETGEGAGWARLVDRLTPFDINRLEVHDSEVAYIDYTAEPNVYLYVRDLDAKVTNLRNVKGSKTALPSDIAVSGSSIGQGKLSINGKMNALKDVPDFDISFALEEAALKAFNDYTNEAIAVDFEGGSLSIYSELAAANNVIDGYVKPILNDVSMVSLKQDSNPFSLVWQSIASIFVELFENQSKDQFALRIPIGGTLDGIETNVWPTGFFSIFKNAFVQAFDKSSDGTIDFSDVVDDEKEKDGSFFDAGSDQAKPIPANGIAE